MSNSDEERTKYQPLAEHYGLEPFASILVTIVVPEALGGGWFGAKTRPSDHELRKISMRIEAELQQRLGHELDPAIWVHALLVCVHFAHQVVGSIGADTDRQGGDGDLDAAYSLVERLKLFHHLYDLYLRIG